MNRPKRYSTEVGKRAVSMVLLHRSILIVL
jgi:hypothetical protein